MREFSDKDRADSPGGSPTKGILRPAALDKKFTLSRHAPPEELGYFIEHYWIVRWDLRGEEQYESETLPFPSIHLVIEEGRSGVWGVVTGRFTRLIEGRGRVFGIKFKPGAFRPFSGGAVSRLTDRVLPLSEFFGEDGKRFERDMLAVDDEKELIRYANEFFHSRDAVPDEKIEMINRMVAEVISNREIKKVEDAVLLANMNKRTLQRLFSEYVGVSPKWVIMRYCLQDAADQLARGEKLNLPKLALDLGYFDQAHFIKDFKTTIGLPPGEYARMAVSIR